MCIICWTYISLNSDSDSGSEHDSFQDKCMQQAIEASLHEDRYADDVMICHKNIGHLFTGIIMKQLPLPVLTSHFSQFPISRDMDKANRVVVCCKRIRSDTVQAFSCSITNP